MLAYLFGREGLETPEYALVAFLLIIGVAASIGGVRDAVIAKFNDVKASLGATH